MSVAANQQRTFLRLLAQLRPHWRRDPALPARLQSLLAAHREFGSRDRRLYRELIFTTLRYLPWIEPLLEKAPEEAVRRVAWLAAELPATKAFRAAFATGTAPTGDKSDLLPPWFRAHCPELFSEQEITTQLQRAPLWLRLQTDNATGADVLDEFSALGWEYRRANVLPGAVEILNEADVTKTEAWRKGLVEVQDLGSQLLLESIGLEDSSDHGRWLDACAGAGGKSLQLSRMIRPGGTLDAFDVRPAALEELRRRAERARLSIRTLTAPPQAQYDGVLVDAPCSGSGTWRRAPHLKWVTTEAHVERAAEKQRQLLAQFAACVRTGGRLIYATCSLSSRENAEVIAAFLAEQKDFQPVPFARTFGARPDKTGITFLPSLHNTDGFFVASLRRR